ncbi:MAG TPA: ABC transporter permease [Vicinamibacterales bacterium]|nr:ABC transporter permease [Vicinamibacterales bacterium]
MSLASDLRSGVRLLARNPIVSLTSVFALALGIALATAGFTAARALLGSRLPYPAADRIVRIYAYAAPGGDRTGLDLARYELLQARTEIFEHVGVAANRVVNVVLPSGRLDAVTAVAMTPATLAYTPFRPVRGRLLVDSDARAGARPVVMIGERFWRREFAADDGAIGRSLEIGGTSVTVVGIAPETMRFPNRPDLWLPLDVRTVAAGAAGRIDGGTRIIGVLRDDVSIEQADADAEGVSQRVAAANPRAPEVRLDVRGYTDYDIAAPLLIVVGALTMILLVIATNIANLVFARSLARAREFAVRAALGASRRRLIAQVFLEVGVLGAVAAPLGLAASAAASIYVASWIEDAPFWMDFTPGAGSAAFVVVVTLLACGVAGAWPALRATRRDAADDLRSGARAGDARFGRVSSLLLMMQVALSIVALYGAAIFADSFRSFGAANPGLPDREVLAATLAVDGVSVNEIEVALRAIPGVRASGVTSSLPRQSPPLERIVTEALSGGTPIEDRAPVVEVTAGALEAIGARPIAGRLLRAADYAPGAPAVAVINEPFARKFFAGASPIGRRFRSTAATGSGQPAPWCEIVGLVPDLGLSPGDAAMAGGYYVPMRNMSFAYAVIRVPGEPRRHAEALRRALASTTPPIIPNRLLTLDEAASEERAMFATVGVALIALGAATLMLALAGVYAMLSLMVTRRTREIGIRVALGAPTAQIVRTIVGRTVWQLGLGALAGGLLARLLLEARGIFVFRLSDGGDWALPTVIFTLAAAGVAASWVPLRRALGVKPVDALRAD